MKRMSQFYLRLTKGALKFDNPYALNIMRALDRN